MMRTFAQDLAAARSQHGGNEWACACGCPLPRSGNSAYATAACRTRAWKRRTGYRKPHRARENAGNGPRTGSNARSGRQLSYRKAVRVFAWLLWLIVRDPELVAVLRNGGPGLCHVLVESELSEALPERQRTRGTHPATTSGP